MNEIQEFKNTILNYSRYPQYQNIMMELHNYSFQKDEDKILISNERNTFTITLNVCGYDVTIKTPHITKRSIINECLDDVISVLYLELYKERRYYNDLLIS